MPIVSRVHDKRVQASWQFAIRVPCKNPKAQKPQDPTPPTDHMPHTVPFQRYLTVPNRPNHLQFTPRSSYHFSFSFFFFPFSRIPWLTIDPPSSQSRVHVIIPQKPPFQSHQPYLDRVEIPKRASPTETPPPNEDFSPFGICYLRSMLSTLSSPHVYCPPTAFCASSVSEIHETVMNIKKCTLGAR